MRLTSIKAADDSEIADAPWKGITETIFANRAAGPRDERALELCEGMIDITAALFNVSSKELRKPGRNSLGISRVRQVAMYVAHVVLKLNMTDIGRAFGRDRTTVLYACHLVEDLRDDTDFDRIITMTERVALAAFGNRLGL
ncbi:helix-turn-helix domain-containing protein [Mesorhizobium sp. KR9-304]|uniref:helix-turn-helix domain-containing protein n=1 Tax=Mesorhizobium sp. KR9-304 TaxID=3156614 RepID=UPI0032B3CE5B